MDRGRRLGAAPPLTLRPPPGRRVVLQCSATVLKEQLKLCLAAEGFGNRLCFLEPTSNAQVCSGRGRGGLTSREAGT